MMGVLEVDCRKFVGGFELKLQCFVASGVRHKTRNFQIVRATPQNSMLETPKPTNFRTYEDKQLFFVINLWAYTTYL